MLIYLILFFIVLSFGLSIGSFITALVPRSKKKKTILVDRSECQNCKHKLGPFELIPLLSFIFQKGKCKHCREKISLFYPLTEILTGITFILVFYRFIEVLDIYSVSSILNVLLLSFLIGIFFSSFIFLAAYDFLYQEVPDKVSIPLVLVLVFVNLVLLLSLNFNINSFITLAGTINIYPFYNLLSGLFAAAFIGVIVMFTRGKGMGGGDIRIAALLGLISSWKGTIVGFYLAFISGSIVGILLALKKKKFKGLVLPFVPFLSLGAVLGFLFSSEVFSFIFPIFQ